jgi:hypothetical protein
VLGNVDKKVGGLIQGMEPPGSLFDSGLCITVERMSVFKNLNQSGSVLRSSRRPVSE